MTKENKEKEQEEGNKTYKMGDDLIAICREIVQLAILTSSNLVDHFRAIVIEVDPDTGKLIPTLEYIEAYNRMIEQLAERAEERQKAALKEAAVTETNKNEDKAVKKEGNDGNR